MVEDSLKSGRIGTSYSLYDFFLYVCILTLISLTHTNTHLVPQLQKKKRLTFKSHEGYYSVLWIQYKLSPIGSCIWTPGTLVMVLFWNAMDPLRDRTWGNELLGCAWIFENPVIVLLPASILRHNESHLLTLKVKPTLLPLLCLRSGVDSPQ